MGGLLFTTHETIDVTQIENPPCSQQRHPNCIEDGQETRNRIDLSKPKNSSPIGYIQTEEK